MTQFLNAGLAEARVWVTPVDPGAAFRTPCSVMQTFVSLIAPDQGEANLPGGDSLSFDGQSALKSVEGPLDFIRLTMDGSAYLGAREAVNANPKEEICGFTVAPKLTRLHSTIAEAAALPGSPDTDLRPGLPSGEPVVEWISEKGDNFERVVPARMPLHGGLWHRAVPANQTIKARTKNKWKANAAVLVGFDLNGVAWGHTGDPSVRLEWGGSYALVLRGIGPDARPVLERKRANSEGKVQWRTWRKLDRLPPMDAAFWKARHQVVIYQIGGLMVVAFDGQGAWIGSSEGGILQPIEWKEAPLRVVVSGADCLFQLFQGDFDQEVKFSAEKSTEYPPAAPVAFTLKDKNPHQFAVGSRVGRGKMLGSGLERTELVGHWDEDGTNGPGLLEYEVTMRGSKEVAPLLMAFASQFPATALQALPSPVDLRPALLSLEIESGDPETLPTGEARLEIAFSALQTFVTDWDKAVLPFRPVHIEVDEKGDGTFETVFKGYLLPDGIGSEGWNQEHLSVIARDKRSRLREPAALVDERFGPLDLLLDAAGGQLFGGQCFQYLMGLELGEDEALAINGNGDPFRYYADGHYPLLSDSGQDYFRATAVPANGGFSLGPPHGEDLDRWFGSISGYDKMVWFYDPRIGTNGGFVYGDVVMLFAERSQTVHTLNGNSDASPTTELSAWPLLGRYSAQGLLEKSYTQIQVFGMTPEAATSAFYPSLYTGRAGALYDSSSLDPLSENQSWRRTLLSRYEWLGKTEAGGEFADALAWRIWQEFDGRAPQRWEFVLQDQILTARWGELVNFEVYELRVVRTKLIFKFTGDLERTTEITARSLSATGL